MTATVLPPATTGGPRPRRRPGLVVVTAIGLLIALASIAWATFAALTVSVRQEASDSASYTGVQSITVDTDDADVTITAASGDATRFDQQVQWSFRRPTVSVAQNGNQLIIRSHCPFQLVWSCSVRLAVQLPPSTAVEVHTGSGNIAVAGLTAGATLTTSDGSIKATGVVGNLTMRSSNGNVTATDTRSETIDAASSDGSVRVDVASSPTEVRATSSNGNVTVLVPDQPGVAYQVTSHTGNGSRTVAVRTDPSSPRHITARSSDGDVRVGYR
jgi:DUF4097 and DUF4098 domain-containing protein YvlB